MTGLESFALALWAAGYLPAFGLFFVMSGDPQLWRGEGPTNVQRFAFAMIAAVLWPGAILAAIAGAVAALLRSYKDQGR